MPSTSAYHCSLHLWGKKIEGNPQTCTIKLENLRCLLSGRSLKEFKTKKAEHRGGKTNEGGYWSGKGDAFAFGLVPILCFLCSSSFSTTIWQCSYRICSLCFITVNSYLQVCIEMCLLLILFIVIWFISSPWNYNAGSLTAGTISLYLSRYWDMFSFS